MGLLLRRFWRTIGWFGLAGLVFTILVLLLLGSGGLIWDSRLINILKPVILLIIGLAVAATSWGVYSRSVETSPYQEILEPLLASREEFCLVLRPFGSDGEVIVPHLGNSSGLFRAVPLGTVTPTMTLEQVVSRAARRRTGMSTYAVVDQNRTLAPPGPIYLRSSNTEWQTVVSALIRRAHTIAILLPPGQNLRRALEWELQEILRLGRESRVVIVLPPSDRKEYDHATARRQAAVLLAAIETPATPFRNVRAQRIAEHLAALPEHTLVVKVRPGGETLFWYSVPRRWRRVATDTYSSGLEAALDANEEEFAGLGFSARYGRSRPPRVR